MNETLLQRLSDLHNVLVYCSQIDASSFGKSKVFSLGERICINQERGSLFSQLALNNKEIFQNEVRTYKVTEELEKKIKQTIEKIEATTWGGFSNDQILK